MLITFFISAFFIKIEMLHMLLIDERSVAFRAVRATHH